MYITSKFIQVVQEFHLVDCWSLRDQTKGPGLFGFLIFHYIGTFCYSKVLVEAGQIGEFAAKKEEKSARLKKHCGWYVLLESYQGLQRFSEKKKPVN